MAAPTRTPDQILAHREQIAARYLRGEYQVEIAAARPVLAAYSGITDCAFYCAGCPCNRCENTLGSKGNPTPNVFLGNRKEIQETTEHFLKPW